VSLDSLYEALRAEDGLLGELACKPAEEATGPSQLAARGPRIDPRGADYELLLEMILEGSRLHYGSATVVRTRDRDLELLLGDQLYAMGLARLAALDDLDAVAELADLISLVAQANAAGERELADAAWHASATAIGWGPSTEHEAAKASARAGDASATSALRRASLRVAQ